MTDDLYAYPDDDENGISNKKLLSVALAHANMVREALAIGEGKLPRLPKGVRGDASFCVLARALSNGWMPKVAQTRISLSHLNEGFDWIAAAQTLRQQGFENVRVGGKPTSKNRSISFRTTTAMNELIERFDSGDILELVHNAAEKKLLCASAKERKQFRENVEKGVQKW